MDNRRIAKNTLFLYFRMFLVMGISLITAGVTLRVLGAVDYGIYSVMGGVVALFSFLNGSLASATSRNITYELGRKDIARTNAVFNASMLTFIGLSILIVILMESVGLWFFYNKMVIPEERIKAAMWVFQLSVINVPLSLTQIPYSATLVAHENMKIYAYVGIADAFARLAIAYMLIVSPFDKLITYSSLGFAWSAATIIFYRTYCRYKYPETKFNLVGDRKVFKTIVGFAGSDLMGNLSFMVQNQGFNLLLNTFFGPVVNAARGIASNLQGMTTQFSSNFLVAVSPQIIKSYASGHVDDMWLLVKRSSRICFCLVWLLALPAILEADYLLKFWLGNVPDRTISFFHLIMVVCLIRTLQNPIIKVIHATGKLFVVNLVSGTILCLSFPVAYFLLRLDYPPETVFWATIISMAIGSLTDLILLRRNVAFNVLRYLIGVHGRCLLATIISAIIPVTFYNRIMEPCFIRLIVTGLITTVSVGLTTYFIACDAHIRERINAIILTRVALLRKSRDCEKGL